MKSELGRIKFVDRSAPENSLENMKQSATLSCAGTPTGERALIQFDGKKTLLKTFDDLGMRPKMQEQLKEHMAREQGMLLLSAMPGMGLRTAMHVLLRSADRFTRDYVSIEDEANRYEVVENVPATTYKAAAGQTPATVIPNVANQEPNVFVVRDLVNAETVSLLLAEIPRRKLVISSIRAANAVEAVYRVLALKVPPSDLAQGISRHSQSTARAQALRTLQGTVHAARANAGPTRPSRRTDPGILPPATTTRRGVPGLWRNRLHWPDGGLRNADRQ